MPDRRIIKKNALHKRYLGLLCKESRRAELLTKRLRQLIMISCLLNYGADRNDVEAFLILVYMKRRMLLRENLIFRAPFVSLHRTIVSFSDVDVPNLFRFRSCKQLQLLYVCLQIPARMSLPSRNTCSGEELLLVGILRISSASRLQDFDSWISEVFTHFVI